MPKIRTMIQLDPDQFAMLRAASYQHHRSIASLIRSAIDTWFLRMYEDKVDCSAGVTGDEKKQLGGGE